MARASAHPITNHEEIRQWAEQRGAKPTCVRNTGDEQDVGMIRLDFPGYSGENSLQEISWDEWFQKFDETNLVLLVQNETAGGEQSNFNKLVSRDTVRAKSTGTRKSAGSQSGARAKQRSSSSGSTTQRSRASADRRTKRSSSSRQSSSRARSRTSRRKSSARRARRSSTTAVSARGRKASTTARGKKSAASTRGNQSRRRAA